MFETLTRITSNISNINLEHLTKELDRVELRLRLQALQAQSRDRYWERDDMRGLYVSEEEASELIGRTSIPPCEAEATIRELLEKELARLENECESRKRETTVQGATPRLERLIGMYGLTPFARDVLLLCLIPELDTKSERLFGYIQDDVTKRRPTGALALELFCRSFEERLAARVDFSAVAPLAKYHLLSLHDETPRKNAPLLAKSLKISDRIRDYLLGFDDIEPSLTLAVTKFESKISLEGLVLPDDLKTRLVNLVNFDGSERPMTMYFHGLAGTGKTSCAGALCHRSGAKLLVADLRLLLSLDLPFATAVNLVCREGMLQEAPVYFDNFDILFGDEMAVQLELAVASIKSYPRLCFLSGRRAWQPHVDWGNKQFMPVAFPFPDYDQRRQLWRIHLQNKETGDTDVAGHMAGKFRLSGGQIQKAAGMARSLALWRNEPDVSKEDLELACRQESSRNLVQLAHKVEPKFVWDDIVLPNERLGQLQEICDHMKFSELVYGKWGFNKLSPVIGLNILFAGPSGTGKTMAAEIMSNELGLDLYKIDLAVIVSKYIGETEKNLDRIFKEAQDSNCILFFDEADAIFGKRSEVRDSHDRYANIEIAYLLQKMEEYSGIVILATNLRKNLDEAFARRMHFCIEFPFPEETDRHLIWQKVFPTGAPLAVDVDLGFMARQFKITGGSIKNIALGAAFMAAASGGVITMDLLIVATKREYQKMGRLCTEVDFGKFYEMVKG